MARLKIYTDENVDVRVAEGLRRRGVEASTAYDAQNVGITDEIQLARAAAIGAEGPLGHPGRPPGGRAATGPRGKPRPASVRG